MGNQQGKLQHQHQSGRPKKMVHWKSAERPMPPGRPILIPLSDQQPDVVNLRWERPRHDGGSPIIGYIVEHRRMGSPHWVRATPTPVPRCEVSISGLEPGWRYQFRVFSENVVGRSESSELSDALTVTLQRNAISVPRFTEELQDTQAVEDERTEFRVRVVGQPPPEINWFKDGYEIFSSRRTKIVNDNDVSVLIIHQVALTDEGEIKCTATNRAGHVVTKARLLVQAPPKIRLPRTYEDGLIVEADEVLRLKVGVAGQPPPAVTWMHEGEQVPNSGRFEIVNSERNSMLKIDNVQRDDRGEYTVRASNKLGDDTTSFLVTVTARPNPPGRVRLNMSFGKSATLSWTAPIDDGGCKIGNYIVEYFRIGWNVWLKAATTRMLSTTLSDLIEGSEYKFRVKAENPYGVSDPSEESEILFIPDPKRGIVKPKSGSKLDEDTPKPVAPMRKTLSPTRPQRDAATETSKVSPLITRKPKPQLLDNDELHREMSYGTPDQVLKMDVRKSPSQSSADSSTQITKPKLTLKITEPTQLAPAPRSPQHSPNVEGGTRTPFLQKLLPTKYIKQPSPLKEAPKESTPPTTPLSPSPNTSRRNLATADPSAEPAKASPLPVRKSPTPPEPLKVTPALQRSAEPVQLGVNQNVRRYSSHGLSPAKNVPALAIAIATVPMGTPLGNGLRTNGNSNGNGERQPTSPTTNPIIQISAPPQPPAPLTDEANADSSPQEEPLSGTDRHDDVHTSNEFMLVVFDKHSKVKDKDKQDSFELDLEDALQPPPISISAPDLASLEFTNLHTFPLRRSVSSTELLYERAMARFYEAVELEEAEKARKKDKNVDPPVVPPINVQPATVRKRLGSMTEAERLSFERRSELRRKGTDMPLDLNAPMRWGSRDNITGMRPLSRTHGMMMHKRQESQESDELSDYQPRIAPNKGDSYDLGSDYTESTASSEVDSIEKFKMELLARTRSPSPRELETYHPRNMTAGKFTPYRAPTPEQAVVVLNRPMPLPSPDFVPKPILKRSSNENVQQQQNDSNQITSASAANNSINPGNEKEKMDIGNTIKSFFKRDKRSATEKNTEENQLISNPKDKATATKIAAEVEVKRKTKEEEERKRKEAEQLMQEEAHAAVDHYSDLVQQVSSTRKYHTPLYMDRDELKRVTEKAVREGVLTDDDEGSLSTQMKIRRSQSPDGGLMPPVSNKPRLSISERGQMIHVRETASNLAYTEKSQPQQPETPSEDSAPFFPTPSSTSHAGTIEATDTSESVGGPSESRGRTRIVKVKRIVKKRVASGTRSRDTSTSRPPSSMSRDNNNSEHHPPPPQNTAARRRVASRTRNDTANTVSPGPTLPQDLQIALPKLELSHALQELHDRENISPERMTVEAHEKVRSALSYSTDLMLFALACYVYLFKDARLVLPILALMVYRQIGEAVRGCLPLWLRRRLPGGDSDQENNTLIRTYVH